MSLSRPGVSDAGRLLGLLLQDRLARRMAAVMLGVTLALIAVFAVSGIWDTQPRAAQVLHDSLGLGRDDGIAESFNHGLAFLAAFSFLLCYFQVPSRVFVFLTVLYGFIWFDDSARYHERVGEKLGQALDVSAGPLGPQEIGELLAWAAAGVLIAAVFLWFWRRRRPGDAGAVLPFFLCFVLLVVCGVAVDMLHAVLPERFDTLMQVIEDGGEMIAVALSAALAFGLSRNVRAYYGLGPDMPAAARGAAAAPR